MKSNIIQVNNSQQGIQQAFEETRRAAEIAGLSEKEAILKTDEELALYTTLMLRIGEDLYAKVTGAENGTYRLCFTAKPPCFSAWLREAGYEAEGEKEA